MSKLFSRISGFFSNKNFMGIDKAGNRYFARKEEIDGVMKEKRWVKFKGEEDPTSIPVEWICWLNGQRKIAPTPEEMEVLEARRERVRQNVALLKKEEEEKKLKEGNARKGTTVVAKSAGPDLRSFIRQFPTTPTGDKSEEEEAVAVEGPRSHSRTVKERERPVHESSEPTGSGATYRPGTWQPPA